MLQKKNFILYMVFVIGITLLFTACQRQDTNKLMDDPREEIAFDKAVVVLQSTQGSSANGVVTFTKVEDGIKVEARVEGLAPGDHGFHIHEFGDIREADGTSAGGHFNPFNVDHGAPTDSVRHVGDLGNITADENGIAHYSRVDTMITFDGTSSIIGRAVIVHAGADDFTSQPTGAAGSRVAMGIIGVANPDYSPKEMMEKKKNDEM